jgi:hypothetical protein
MINFTDKSGEPREESEILEAISALKKNLISAQVHPLMIHFPVILESLFELLNYRRKAEDNSRRPTIVCLCGSTRFWRDFQRASLQETMAGKIVLSIGAASGTDDEHFGNLPREEYDRIKGMLDELHLRKIDLADEVLILNVGGYIGESTSRELAYAKAHGKRVRYLGPIQAE